MKRMKLSMKILMVPILLGLLCCAVGGGCIIMPWGWGHDRGGGRGDHHRDGHRD